MGTKLPNIGVAIKMKINEHLEKNSINRSDLIKDLDCNRVYLNRIESGKIKNPPAYFLVRLSSILNVSLIDLYEIAEKYEEVSEEIIKIFKADFPCLNLENKKKILEVVNEIKKTNKCSGNCTCQK